MYLFTLTSTYILNAGLGRVQNFFFPNVTLKPAVSVNPSLPLTESQIVLATEVSAGQSSVSEETFKFKISPSSRSYLTLNFHS